METAGRGATQWILSRPHWPGGRRSLIVCGKGNNGGDGLVVARHLALEGWQVDVLLTSDASALSQDASHNLKRLRDLQAPNVTILEQATPHDISRLAPLRPLIIDALLGTGVNGPLTGSYADIIEAMASSECPIVAMDLPSGLNADTGLMQGPALPCVATVNFGTRKRGCYFGDRPDLCGEVVFVDLGFSEAIVEDVLSESQSPAQREYLILPERLHVEAPKRSYKYDGRSVVIVGGATGMVGAPIMAAKAAWSLGLGDVRCIFPKSLAEAYHVHIPFLANVPVGEASDDHFVPSMLDASLEVLNRRDSVLLLGPGLGRNPESLSFASLLLQSWRGPTLIDADALLALNPDLILNPLLSLSTSPSVPTSVLNPHSSILLTPHKGELRQLAPGIDDPLAAADHAAQQFGATVLAKGFPSVTHTPDGTRFVTGFDTRVFNKVGYGDVLAGLAAGYMALGGDAATSAIAAQIESYKRYQASVTGGTSPDPWDISDRGSGIGGRNFS
jgi:ADP-dependent NAD(P)H-hydrate dehydratase / NAD(P)H-hydrate epimerase